MIPTTKTAFEEANEHYICRYNRENLSTCAMVAENRSSRSSFCIFSHISLSISLAALTTNFTS